MTRSCSPAPPPCCSLAVLVLLASLAVLFPMTPGAAGQTAEDAPLPDWLKPLRLRGRLKEEFAYRISDPSDVSKLRTIGWLDARYDVSDSVNLRLQGRGRWDGVFAVTDQYPRNVRRDQEWEFSLRQALLSVSRGPFDLRLGRQQIVWGEAIGTFITDVVNPKDFREFILPDFTELRLPIWAVNATYHVREGLILEGVWTPDTRFHKVGKRGSEFEFQGPRYRFQNPVVMLPDDRDEFSLDRSEGGVRLSWLVRGWDLSFIYYDAADKTAVLHQRRVSQARGPTVVVLEPRHSRLHIMGGTVAKGIEPVVLRSEAVYTIGKRYETTDPLDPDGVVRRDTLDYLVGLDYTLFQKLDTALQFSQKVLTGSATNLTRGAVEAQVTSSIAVRVATGFLRDTLNPSLLFVVNLNRADYRVSPKLEYLPTGSVTLTLGADIFAGPVDTLYGQFHAKDRVYVDVSWKF